MVWEDLPEVMEIERESFPSPWSLNLYQRELRENSLARYLVAHRVPRSSAKEQGVTATKERLPILGFLGLWLIPGEAHLTTLAVRAEERRRGIAELLLLSAIELAWGEGAERITLEVRASNTAALALYQKFAFLKVGFRPYYYEDREDALLLTSPPLNSPHYRARLAELKASHSERRSAQKASPLAGSSGASVGG